ncbi:MAG: hypothetical protein KDA84_22665, partial [Planctomycetaceae bacterium]|nr:hypothetical protein [Planctomycetaceae bacterium]
DGLESVAERTSLDEKFQESTPLVFSDYEIPLPFSGWQNIPLWRYVSVALAGILGSLAVLVMGYLMGRALPAKPASVGGTHGG